jgi:hypothetical protein
VKRLFLWVVITHDNEREGGKEGRQASKQTNLIMNILKFQLSHGLTVFMIHTIDKTIPTGRMITTTYPTPTSWCRARVRVVEILK